MDKELCKLPLFVYGSLKRGFPNHGRIQSSKFLGNGKVSGTLFDLGPFPGVYLDSGPINNSSIKGEVFHTDQGTLATVDALEAEGTLYNRRVVEVQMDDGTKLKAWTYELDKEDERRFAFKHVIPSGEWRKGEPII